MKSIFIINLLMFTALYSYAQTSITEYEYDALGNCIGRYSTIVMQKKANKLEEVREIEKYEDEIVDISLFPNPTKDFLVVKVSDNKDDSVIKCDLYDLSGKFLKSIVSKESEITLDLSIYPTGVYILKLNRNNKISSWRIIKID